MTLYYLHTPCTLVQQMSNICSDFEYDVYFSETKAVVMMISFPFNAL